MKLNGRCQGKGALVPCGIWAQPFWSYAYSLLHLVKVDSHMVLGTLVVKDHNTFLAIKNFLHPTINYDGTYHNLRLFTHKHNTY
jgi:hypothetical protein